MNNKQIGALLIGQSPRPDLVKPLAALLPDWEIIQAGALDGLATAVQHAYEAVEKIQFDGAHYRKDIGKNI